MIAVSSTRSTIAGAFRTSRFDSQGTSCGATFYLPSGVSSANKSLPSILLIYGWGGIQTSFLAPFREHFLSLGFAVMTFDFRFWGESGGQPRHVIRVKDRIVDAEAALAHLKAQPEVDPSSIFLWGSSLGGGIACTLAERHPELKGVIAQVPMLDGRAASSATPLPRRMRLVALALADLFRLGPPLYIPIVGEPGQFSTMDRDDAAKARRANERLSGVSAANYIAARSALTMLNYRPIKTLKRINVPTLMIGGKHDTVAPFIEKAIRKVCNPQTQIELLDANHFEPYLPPVLENNLTLQGKFLKRRMSQS